jgi:hypothetical protein
MATAKTKATRAKKPAPPPAADSTDLDDKVPY